MRARTGLTLVAALILLVFLLMPAAGQQQRPGKSKMAAPETTTAFTSFEAPPATESVPLKHLLKAGNSPLPPTLESERDVLLPTRAGTGGGDIPEAEPNNDFATANIARDIPFECTGSIHNMWDIDMIRMAVSAGEPIQVTVWRAAGFFTSPLDPVVVVYTSSGTLFDWNDDIAPGNHNAQVNFIAPYTGDMYLSIRTAVPAGSPDHRYIVAVWPSWNGVLDPANVESEPNNLAHLADAILTPGGRWGIISTPGDVDYTYFDAPAGATVVVDVHSAIYLLPLDPVIELYDSYGRMLVACDDMDAADPRLNVVIPETGRYYLAIRDHNSTASPFHLYILNVSLQDGTAAPHITKLKFTADGRLKRVQGTNFDPTSEVVEVGGIVVASTPAPAKPTTLIKVKPAVAVPVGDAVTVVLGSGRRSNPVIP